MVMAQQTCYVALTYQWPCKLLTWSCLIIWIQKKTGLGRILIRSESTAPFFFAWAFIRCCNNQNCSVEDPMAIDFNDQ